ncbi:hypothetical protein N7513_003497 [Penicillium frequentans]|nr:hypothetical protein N7513_003497 [Penicillium glabrum]
MKSTTLSLARSQAVPRNTLPGDVGKHAKRVDAALPGKHTRLLYYRLSVRADKPRKLWSTSSFDVGSGPDTGRICYNVTTPTEGTYPST